MASVAAIASSSVPSRGRGGGRGVRGVRGGRGGRLQHSYMSAGASSSSSSKRSNVHNSVEDGQSKTQRESRRKPAQPSDDKHKAPSSNNARNSEMLTLDTRGLRDAVIVTTSTLETMKKVVVVEGNGCEVDYFPNFITPEQATMLHDDLIRSKKWRVIPVRYAAALGHDVLTLE